MTARLQQYRRSTAPRYVDFYTQLVILCSGFMSIFGWSFFGFGMIFVWVFGLTSTVMDWSINSFSETTEGQVIKVESTNYSENEQTIYEVTYSFQSEGDTYEGQSYTKTWNSHQVGDKVEVEYNINNPDTSNIIGLRSRPFTGLVFFIVLIFPMIGLIFIAIALYKNRKALGLLKNGEFTTATKISKESTNSSITINNRHYPIYKYEFGFEAEGGRYIANCKTHLTEKVEDEKEEIILYQGGYPDYNMVYDAIENMPDIDEYGNVTPVSPKKGWVLIIPGLAVIVHGLIFLFVYF